MNGGDLRFHISRKTFTEEAVRFWIAELGCALRYIHRQGIIHRDIKPDNVLLDSEGHIHLADFVSSSVVDVQEVLLIPPRMLRPISHRENLLRATLEPLHIWHQKFIKERGILQGRTG